MDLHLTLTRRGHLGDDVYQQLRAAILDGRLAAGTRLPATRELAARLSVSRNVVLTAFERLIAEGFATGRIGAGTFVAAVTAATARRAPAGRGLVARTCWGRVLADAPALLCDSPYDLRLGSPDPTLFPWDAWRSAVARQLRGRRRGGRDSAPEGERALRAAIARHVGVSRAVVAGPDDVVVTNGAQQALDLIARVLIEPGSCVAIEEPGYLEARRVFELAGARVVPVPVDAEGLVVTRLPAAARLVYVTPSHQFPLGMPMSLPRRVALLAWAERQRAAIVEDDYDSEFRFDGRPLEPLQSLDRAGRVLYVGSFSKVLLPSLRTGFIVAPASIMAALHAAKRLADRGGPGEPQRALAELIDDGVFARHVRRMIRSYRERRDALVAAVAEHLAGALTLVPAPAGLHVSAYLDRRADAAALQRRAAEVGVVFHTLTPHYLRRPRPGIALGFGLIQTRDIGEAVRRLARVM